MDEGATLRAYITKRFLARKDVISVRTEDYWVVIVLLETIEVWSGHEDIFAEVLGSSWVGISGEGFGIPISRIYLGGAGLGCRAIVHTLYIFCHH